MRSINREVLLRNRGVFMKARDDAFAAAEKVVDEILSGRKTQRAVAASPQDLQDTMARLVDRLYHARYFARLSAGGNTYEPPPEVDYRERAYVDHVEAMYSYSRSINRLLRHETLIDSFAREHPDVSAELRGYLNEIRKSDVNLIYANLRSMKERMNRFRRFMTRSGLTPTVRAAVLPRRDKETVCPDV